MKMEKPKVSISISIYEGGKLEILSTHQPGICPDRVDLMAETIAKAIAELTGSSMTKEFDEIINFVDEGKKADSLN